MKFIKIAAILTFLVGFQANANLITIQLDSTEVAVGETINVSLWADFTDSVDTLGFDFIYNTSVFALVDGSVVTDLLNDGFDYFFETAENATGLGLAYFSFADTLSGNFLLASFELVALQTGSSDFSLDTLLLSNEALFEDYDLEPVAGKSADVLAAVSAPASLGLFTLAMFGLVGLRRKA